MARDVRGILLCGGRASRFGAEKLLAGSPPIACEAARRLREGVGHALAVLPIGKERLREALELAGCEILETDRTQRGMSGSIAAGIEATAGAEGWVIALGDMPRVAPETIRAVANAVRDGALIALPVDLQGRRGHPVGFAAALREELLALEGDVGARALLERHAARVRVVPTSDPGIFIDIDTPVDLETGFPPARE
jgi:molybdenum cofactor cytidylyltransferase